MPDKAIGSPAEPAGRASPNFTVPADSKPSPNRLKHDDGITNPRDGRGPLRRRDDQAAKLPLRPPH
jgi:hypothetical protein